VGKKGKKGKKQAGTLTGPSLATNRPDAWLDGVLDMLPDPDPVLARLSDGGEAMLSSAAADGIVFSLIQTRKSAVLSREFRIVAGETGDEASPASEKLAADFKADLASLDLYGLIGQILGAALWGFVPIELCWRAEGLSLRLDKVQALERSWFGFESDGSLMFRQQGGVPVPVVNNKVVLARVGETLSNPYGERALTRCLWPVAFKKGGLKAWVKLAEDMNLPLMIGKYQSGTPESEQVSLLSALSAARVSGTAVVDQGVEVDVVTTSSKGSGAGVHEGLVDKMDKVLARVITGQTLTHDIGQSGSRAASETHLQVMGSIQQADMALVRNTFAEIARTYRDLNDKSAEPPKLVWFEEEDPQAEWANRDETLSKLGVRFTKGYLMDRYGFSEGDLDVVEPPQQKTGSGPVESSNSGDFSEQGDLIGELAGDLQPIARWAMSEAEREEADLLGMLGEEITSAKNFEELGAALDSLAEAGPAEPLAIALAAGRVLGRGEAKNGQG